MEFTFFSAAGVTLFTRSDAESAHWTQEEMTVNATFPFVDGKVIERGQRLAFRDPATDTIEVFEVRSVSTIEPDHYQQISAEAICLSELQDEHINTAEITEKTAAQALTTVLAGTMWSVGTNTASGTQSADISRGSVWQAVNTIKSNWNVYITPRVVITNGAITGRFLDISPAQGTWRGVRLSVRKNMLDANVTYNDEDVLTALYGYGGTIDKPRSGGDDEAEELTFADVVWTATGGHPAKPAGQTYLEDPSKTAIYGRNGRPRFGYYQNANIKDADVLLQKTWEALQRTYEPKISISGTVADLYRLGYKDEPLRLHDTAIVEVEETGETFQKELIRLDVDLLDASGDRVDIGDYIPNIVYINRDTAEKAGGGGGGGGRGQTPNEAEQVQTFAEFAKTNDMIGMVVGMRNGGYYVKAGEIVLAINEEGGTNIKLSADTIDIDGLITLLEAKDIGVGGLNVEGLAYFHRNVDFEANITVENKITCFGFEVDEGAFTVFGNNATWQNTTVVTSVTPPSLSRTASFSVVDTDGTTRTGRLVTSWSAGSSTTATIHYLGKAAT